MSYLNFLVKEIITCFPETSERISNCCLLLIFTMDLYSQKKIPTNDAIQSLQLAIFYLNGEDVFYMHKEDFLDLDTQDIKKEFNKILMDTL